MSDTEFFTRKHIYIYIYIYICKIVHYVKAYISGAQALLYWLSFLVDFHILSQNQISGLSEMSLFFPEKPVVLHDQDQKGPLETCCIYSCDSEAGRAHSQGGVRVSLFHQPTAVSTAAGNSSSADMSTRRSSTSKRQDPEAASLSERHMKFKIKLLVTLLVIISGYKEKGWP